MCLQNNNTSRPNPLLACGHSAPRFFLRARTLIGLDKTTRPPPASNTQPGIWDPHLGHPQLFSRGCAPGSISVWASAAQQTPCRPTPAAAAGEDQ